MPMDKVQLRKPLSDKQYANLFAQLARLEQSGLPPSTAFSMALDRVRGAALALNALRRAVARGNSIAKAGLTYRILSESQAAIIEAAEASGQVQEAYRRLADLYQNKARRVDGIKSRLTMPVAVLVAAAVLEFLPAFAAGEISGLAYLGTIVKTLGPVLALAVLALQPSGVMAALGLARFWAGLQLKLPVVGDWVRKRQINEFFNVLGLMLHAGMDFNRALPKAVKVISNSALREQFHPVLSASFLLQGRSVYETLSQVPALAGKLMQTLKSGESSGSLAQSMLHQAKRQSEEIALQDDQLAELIPKALYVLIALQVAWSTTESYRVVVAPGY